MALAAEEVGARIRQARLSKGWTHEEFARRAGVGLRTVQRWQKGRNPKNGESWLPRLNTLMDLAELFDVPRSYFVETEDPQVALRDVLARLGDVESEVAAFRRELRGEEAEDPEEEDEPGEPPAGLP